MKSLIKIIIPALILTSCAAINQPATHNAAAENISNGGKLWTSFWQQKAAEYKALCYQAFNIAKEKLDIALQKPVKNPAVITDIDETLLDNSPNSVYQALQGKNYEQKSWEEWTAKAIADTLAGAPWFLKYASSKGVEVFYITNRLETERAGTLKNLQKYHFPCADSAHVLFKENGSSKESRRQKVMQTHTVILLLGDNLADFDKSFDNKSTQERAAAVNQSANRFGNRFIVLPNANYGDWEGALYHYQYNLNAAQKDSVIKKAVRGEE